MDKQTSIVTTKSLGEVHDMIGYGTHLQPLPCKYNESGITFGKRILGRCIWERQRHIMTIKIFN